MQRPSRSFVLVVGLIALLAATAAITASVVTGGSKVEPRPAKRAAPSLLAGIPQRGLVLGSPRAPVTLVEFADLQCPYCGEFARNALPTIVADYVRTGKVRVVFEGLAFVGPDSDRALRAVLAASRQNHAWEVLDGLYERQGAENTGWVTDDLVRDVGRGVRGLDTERMLSERWSVDRLLAASQGRASRAGIDSTPSFQVGPTGGRLQTVELNELSADALRPYLDHLLAS